MKQTLLRILVVAVLTLFLGLGINQFKEEGFHWQFVAYALPDAWSFDNSVVIPADSAFAAFLDESAVFIDIRSRVEYQVDHVPNAVLYPYHDFRSDPGGLNPDFAKPLCVVYGDRTMTHKAFRVARQIKRINPGMSVAILENGYGAWLSMDFPVESKGE